MRLLLANTGHPATIRGGAEAAVFDLARRLAARGHSVALVVHHAGRRVEVDEDRGVRIHALPNRNLYYGFDGAKRIKPLRFLWHGLDGANPWMAAAFGRVLDLEKPDVVNTHVLAGLSQLVWREAWRRGIPIVHYLHEYGTMCPRGSAFSNGAACIAPCGGCRLLGMPRKRLSGLVDSVVGVSRFTLERHLAWGFFPNARRSVLPNVFEGMRFVGRKPPRDGPLRLGYFGRLIPEKGAHLLIEAVRRLPPRGWSLDVAGAGDEAYIATLRAAAPADVRFLGWTPAGTFFDRIDILVVPSVWPEPQPRVTFEAFMHGVPVIGSTAGGIPAQIDDGETGWLFGSGSADDLARILRQRLADRTDRVLPADAFARRLALLQPDRVAALYEQTYAEAVDRGRGRAGPAVGPKAELAEHSGNG